MKILDLHLPEDVVADLRKIIKERVQSRPENAGVQAQIVALQRHLARQRELYVLGDYDRDEYMAARAEKMAEIAELERELGGADYPLEAALTRINRMGDILRDGTRNQQKRAINLMFDKILVDNETKIKGVELQDWAQPLFADLLMVSGDHECPQGTSSAHRVATLAGLKTCRKEYTTTSENRKTAPRPFLRPCPDFSATQLPKTA